MISGAEWGAAFGAAFASVESFKNLNDGYGFGTNDGRFNKLAKDAVSFTEEGAIVNPVKAQRALDFWEKRFGGPDLTYTGRRFNETLTDANGNIGIHEKSFLSGPKALRSDIVHEYGHYYKDVNWKDGKVGESSYKEHFKPKNPDFNGDGINGYKNAIDNAGKYHINGSVLKNKVVEFYQGYAYQRIYNPDAWKRWGNMFKLIPTRF